MNIKDLGLTEMSKNEMKETKGGIGLFFIGLTIIAGAAIYYTGKKVSEKIATKRNAELAKLK